MNELSDQDKQSFIEAAEARLRKVREMSAGSDQDLTKPAFRYPSSGRRPESLNQSRDVNAPLQLARGWAAGLLGLPGDIEGLVRLLPGLDETPVMPTSEFYLEYLPGYDDRPFAKAISGIGAFAGGAGATNLVRGVAKAAKQASGLLPSATKDLLSTAGQKVKQAGLEAAKVAAKPVEQAMTEGKGPLAAALAPVRPSFAVTPTPTPPAPVQARVSPLGFYSPAEQAILNTPRNKPSPGSAWLNDIKKAENVTDNEIKQMGLDQFLKSKPTFTKREVQDYIYSNKFDIQEKLFGGEIDPKKLQDGMDLLEDHLYEVSSPTDSVKKSINAIRRNGINDPRFEEHKEVIDSFLRQTGSKDLNFDFFFNKEEGFSATPRYKDRPELQVPGGSNYREMLLTLPKNGDQFRTIHWEDPNVLAHVRMNDRVDSNGKKVLFVEEIQSDWGQQGQKKGFKEGAPVLKIGKRENGFVEVVDQDGRFVTNVAEYDVPGLDDRTVLAEANRRVAEQPNRTAELSKVPRGPFVANTNDWTELALKRVMKRAADEGYDRVAFVSGKQTDDRYKLSKYVTEISAKPTASGRFDVKFTDRDGVSHTNLGMDEDALEATFGKTLASRIIDEDGGTYRDLDLQIKKKWPYQFYDKLVPNVASKLVKKMGGKELTTVSIPQTAEGWPQMELKQIGFDITPEMRKRLKSPIPYKKGGAVMAQKSKQPVKVSDNMYEIRQYMAK